MAVKLRLMRMGKTKQPTYRVVAADARSPRDGRFIEIVGTYQPRAEPSVVQIDNDKAVEWLSKGAADRPCREVVEDLGRVGSVPSREMTDIEGFAGDDAQDADDVDAGEVDGVDLAGVAGGIPQSVLDYVARNIVDEPDAVVVEVEEGRRRDSVQLRLHVAPDDMGKIIGRRGRTAQALRAIVRAAGAKEGIDAAVDIVD